MNGFVNLPDVEFLAWLNERRAVADTAALEAAVAELKVAAATPNTREGVQRAQRAHKRLQMVEQALTDEVTR